MKHFFIIPTSLFFLNFVVWGFKGNWIVSGLMLMACLCYGFAYLKGFEKVKK